jgi:hypothetical protein
MNTTRRKLLFASAGSGALAALLASCGGSDSPSPTPPPPAQPPPPGTLACGATAISANHGHVLTIPAADVDSTINITYSIAGVSGHVHNVTLTPADFAMIKAKTPVTITSTLGGSPTHTHDVTVNCA